MRTILAGVVGALLAHLCMRWLRRRFPIAPKPHPLSWYEQRYTWIEWAAFGVFLIGLGIGLLLYYSGYLPRNDPRGAAVGFALGCLLSLAFLLVFCAASANHRFREYWEFQELKYGARSSFILCITLPVFAFSLYGAVHLVVTGP